MRNDPLFTVWTIRCESPEDLRRIQQLLEEETAPDHILVDRVSSSAGGGESAVERHRIGDYFGEIRSSPGPGDDPSVLRLSFHRLPSAGRYWKDMLVRIIQSVQNAARNVSVTLDYRGDDERQMMVAAEGTEKAK
jgi:hypothetical protein